MTRAAKKEQVRQDILAIINNLYLHLDDHSGYAGWWNVSDDNDHSADEAEYRALLDAEVARITKLFGFETLQRKEPS